MEKEQIIKETFALLESHEGSISINNLVNKLNIDISTLNKTLKNTSGLVFRDDDTIQSRQAYRNKSSYLAKILHNIINKIE